jgi:hypothetical protein
MYIQSTRSKSVSFTTFMKAFAYTYIFPQNGFSEKLRGRFGTSTQLYLNSVIAFTLLIKYLPGRVPGMYIAVDERLEKRFRKIIIRLGMKVLTFSGQTELIDACETLHVIAVIVPDSYAAAHDRYKKRYENSKPIKIAYQNRRRPKSVDMKHDVYVWEPRTLPRSVSGCVVVCSSDNLTFTKQQMRDVHNERLRLSSREFIAELWRSLRGYENKYRRIDRRPPKIMARLLYDILSTYE